MRMDYLRPYSLAHPVQSFTVLSKDPEPQYGYEDSPPGPEGVNAQLNIRSVRGAVEASRFVGVKKRVVLCARLRCTSLLCAPHAKQELLLFFYPVDGDHNSWHAKRDCLGGGTKD